MEIKNYLSDLLRQQFVEPGSHYLLIDSKDNLLQITFTCDVESQNRVILAVINTSSKVIRDILVILRNNYPDNDFLFDSMEYTYYQVIFSFKYIDTYFNLSYFPSDIILNIKQYLNKKDYSNLLEILRIHRYPELIDKLGW